METRDYALEGIPKLRCIAITEIVLGCLAVIGDCSQLYHAKLSDEIGRGVVSIAGAVLLLATGSYGVDVINRFRAGELINPGCFRALAILNMILCVLQCIGLVALITLSSMELAFLDATLIVILVVAVLVTVLCIGLTFMAFKMSRRNVVIIIDSIASATKTKEVDAIAGYTAAPPPYTRTYNEAGSSGEV